MNSYTYKELSSKDVKKLKTEPFYPVISDDNSLTVINCVNGKYFEVWLSDKMTVTKVMKSEDTDEKYLEVVVSALFGEEIGQIPLSQLNKKDILQIQNKCRINENYTSELVKYLVRCSDNVPHITLYESVGWTKIGNEYLFRTNHLISDDINLKNKYQYAGNMKLDNSIISDHYVTELNTLLTTTGTMLAITLGLSSALLSLLKKIMPFENLLVHLYGDSSNGKSTFLRLAVSCWGNPFTSPLVNEWNSTTNAIFATLSGNNGICTGFDEASCSNSDYTTLIYNFSHGNDKAKCNKDSSLREKKTWDTTIISTAEESLLSHSKKNNGIKARCIEFFNLDITENAAHSEDIIKFISVNYGKLGEEFINVLYSKTDKVILSDFDECRKKLDEKIKYKCNISDRVIKNYAVILLTAKYAKELLVHIDVNKIMNCLIKQHEEMREDSDMAYNLYLKVLEYVVNNRSKFPIQNNDNKLGNGDPVNCEGIIIDDTYYYITENTFKKILIANNNTDMNVAVKNLCKDGYLQKQDKKYYKMKTIFGVPSKCYVFYGNKREQIKNFYHSEISDKPAKVPPEMNLEILEKCKVKIPDEELEF